MPSKQVYARQRLLVGVLAGLVGHLVLAFALGLFLAGGISFQVRVLNTLLACVVATPAVLSVGFGCMLKDDGRAFGGGIVGGALGSTLLLAVFTLLL